MIAIFLRGLGDWTSRYTKLSEGLSVVLVSFLLLIILGGAIALLAPSVGEQVKHLREELPKSAQNVSEYISRFSWGKAIIEQLPSVDEITNNINTTSFLSSVGGFFSTTAGAVANFFIVILVAIYLASEPRTYINGFVKLFPLERRTRVREILAETGDTLELVADRKNRLNARYRLNDVDRTLFSRRSAFADARFDCRTFIVHPEFRSDSVGNSGDSAGIYRKPDESGLCFNSVYRRSTDRIKSDNADDRTRNGRTAARTDYYFAIGSRSFDRRFGFVLATPLLAVIMVLVQMVYIQDVLGDSDTEINEENKEKLTAEDAEGRRGN